jgi:hypothetical protein
MPEAVEMRLTSTADELAIYVPERSVGYRLVKVNCSQVLAAARLATSTSPMLRSAETN